MTIEHSSEASLPANRSLSALSIAAFVLGLAVVGWVANGFLGASAFALGMTLLIAAVYLAGSWEIWRFGQATLALHTAMAQVPPSLTQLSDWLPKVPAALRHAVRQRIEAGRSAFPAMTMSPYLMGLLVMLGMLGTFLGMLLTFKGAVFALEGSADLQAIRAALAAPIQGLALSFGTSVAGVATSAALGLMATVARRDRALALRVLDALADTRLHAFSAAHAAAQQRQQSLEAQQRQAEALPAVTARLQALIEQIERRGHDLDAQLLARQADFHQQTAAAYASLAQSVSQSLQDSLAASARTATQSLQPMLQQAMAGIAAESARLHEGVSTAVQAQLTGLAAQFSATTDSVAEGWTRALAERARTDAQHQAQWSASLQSLAGSLQAQWQQAGTQAVAQQQAVMQALQQTAEHWRTELSTLRHEEAARSEAAGLRAAEMQSQLASQLATLGTALEAPLARLMHTASEAPKAAAEVIAQLREQMSHLAERDTAGLAERAELVDQLGSLLRQVQQTTGEQRAAIEQLVAGAGTVLDRVGLQFADTVGAQAGRAEALAEQAARSAEQLASLGAAFQDGAQQLTTSHEQLVQGLQRVEAAIGQSLERSDEQLAYYVAQAREVVDLSISAQQGIVEDLRRLRGPLRVASEVSS